MIFFFLITNVYSLVFLTNSTYNCKMCTLTVRSVGGFEPGTFEMLVQRSAVKFHSELD